MDSTVLLPLAAAAGDSSAAAGLLLLAGLGVAAFVIGRITRRWLSEVIAFMAVGVVVGPDVLGLVGRADLAALDPVVSTALGAIVFGLGARLELPTLRHARASLVPLAVADIGLTFGAVFGLTLLAGAPVGASYLLAAVAVSTSPTTLVAVIGEARARGPLTDHLQAVAAINNVASVALYGLGLPLVLAAHGGVSVGARAFLQLAVVAVAIGMVAGWVLRRTFQGIHSVGERLLLVTLVLVSIVAVATWAGAPVVLATLVAGGYVANDPRDTTPVFDALRYLDAPIFLVFFVVAGAAIHLEQLLTMGLVGAAATLGRAGGKLAGGWVGATTGPGSQRSWTVAAGLGQLPFAGMAIGLAAFTLDKAAATGAGQMGTMVSGVVLGSVVLFELAGPPAVHRALRQVGEAGQDTTSRKVVVDRSAPHTIRRVLFPVSHPEMARRKAAAVADIAASSGAQLVGLHVAPAGAAVDDDRLVDDLSVLAQACRVRGIDYRLDTVASDVVADAIVDHARTWSVDLVLLGEPDGRVPGRQRLGHQVTARLAPDIHVLVVPTVTGAAAQDPTVPATNSSRGTAGRAPAA